MITETITNKEMEIAAAAADVYPPGHGWQVAVRDDGHAYGNAHQMPNLKGIKL